jgi:hypothetical protein
MEVKKQETYELVGKDGISICTVTIIFTHESEDKILLGGEINIIVLHQQKKQGIASSSMTTNYYDFEWWNTQGECCIKIPDFDLAPEIVRKGVGTFIWHSIFWGIPEEIREKLIISGKLAAQDASSERDSLWKNLINYGENSRAVFKPKNTGMGFFRGRIHDVGNSYEEKLNAIKKT